MKNDFMQFAGKDSVMTLVGENKLAVIGELIDRAAELTRLNRDLIFRLTWKRESMMSTGVGKGLALPHIRVNELSSPCVVIGVCKNEIEDYQGQDNLPVRVIAFVVAPDSDQDAYLQLLSSVSRRLRDEKIIGELIDACENTNTILEILTREDA